MKLFFTLALLFMILLPALPGVKLYAQAPSEAQENMDQANTYLDSKTASLADSSVIVIAHFGPSDVFLMPVMISTALENSFTNLDRGKTMNGVFKKLVTVVNYNTYDFLKFYLSQHDLKLDRMAIEKTSLGSFWGSCMVYIKNTNGEIIYYANRRDEVALYLNNMINILEKSKELQKSDVQNIIEVLRQFLKGLDK